MNVLTHAPFLRLLRRIWALRASSRFQHFQQQFFKASPHSLLWAPPVCDHLRHQAAPFACSRTPVRCAVSGLAFFGSGLIRAALERGRNPERASWACEGPELRADRRGQSSFTCAVRILLSIEKCVIRPYIRGLSSRHLISQDLPPIPIIQFLEAKDFGPVKARNLTSPKNSYSHPVT